MAYQKLQVGLAANVIPSDTIDIPLESSSQITGESDASIPADKLTDATQDFTQIQGLKAGAIIVNITDGTIATVTAVDSATVLSLSANILQDASKQYKIFLESKANHSEGCILYIPTDGDIKVKTTSGSEVTYSGVKGGTFLPVFVIRVFATGTTVTGTIIANW